MVPTPPQEIKRQVPEESVSLETPVQYLKGVGPRRAAVFKRLGIRTLRDLITHFPRRHEDRRQFLPIAALEPGVKATVHGRISGVSLFRAKTGTLILQVTVRDASGVLTALWFNQPYLKRWFPVGEEIILYGNPDRIGRKLQMAVPEFELVPAGKRGQSPSGTVPKSLHMGRVVPIYPATSGLHQRELREAAAQALKILYPLLPRMDPLPPALRERHRLLGFRDAVVHAHFPPEPEAVGKARERLAFDELLAFQLAMTLRRRRLEARPGIAHEVSGDRLRSWLEALPFELTPGQRRALRQIARDMAAPRPMRRLLQGEVGSGKTVVAAYAAVVAAQGGTQTVLMAPTEVLARQHALSLSRLLAPAGLSAGLLISSLDEATRRNTLSEVASGAIEVLVGTHAVLEEQVKFKRLGLVVIDEQQKFGVDQRDRITAKGDHPDVLILTATPIPRTLALTLYGEMEVSTLTEKPAGRRAVQTLWMDSTRREEVFTFVRKELEAGRQAYVVCPRIGAGKEASKELFAPARRASAAEMFEEYKRAFSGHTVALLHGRMKPQEQKRIFAAFKENRIRVLVATQVIEVGVDVANATVMVIEGAERFGLSQLHQLRGRVGRGEAGGTCILISDPKDPAALERMQTLTQVSDAFRIAEEDLRLRGPGEMLGKRQSGLPDLKCLEWAAQGPWLEVTRAEAENLLKEDPQLASPELALIKEEALHRFPDLVQGAA